MKTLDTFNPITLNVGFAVHNADWNWKGVSSPFARLYYVTQGEAAIILSVGTYKLCPNHLYMIPAFTVHSNRCMGHFEHYYIHIYEDLADETGFMDDWNFPVEVVANDIDLVLIRRLVELNPQMKLSASDPDSYDNYTTLALNIGRNKQRSLTLKMESRGILLQLISRFFENATHKDVQCDERVVKAKRYILQRICEPLSVKDVADEVCLCKDYFIRLFKAETELTPGQYITLKKMEKAQLMLATQGMSVKDVAYRLGFDDNSYFIRMFKKHVGCTPNAYKEKQRV